MGSISASVVRNAYLHYEALCDHQYNYFCVLCGHNPYLLVTDADKKGMFDLSGKWNESLNCGHLKVLCFIHSSQLFCC